MVTPTEQTRKLRLRRDVICLSYLTAEEGPNSRRDFLLHQGLKEGLELS